MRIDAPFTADEERQLRALAEETGRTLPRLIHFISLFGAAEYRACIEKWGELRADSIIMQSNVRFANVHCQEQERAQPWPRKVEGHPTPTVDDLPEMFEE